MSKVAFNKWLVKCPVDYDASDSFEKEAGDEENYAVIVQYMFFTMWDDEKETEAKEEPTMWDDEKETEYKEEPTMWDDEKETEDEEETEDHVATIELSAKGVQQEHGISFEDACWVVDEMRDSNETNESLSFSEDYFVDEIKGKNEGKTDEN